MPSTPSAKGSSGGCGEGDGWVDKQGRDGDEVDEEGEEGRGREESVC